MSFAIANVGIYIFSLSLPTAYKFNVIASVQFISASPFLNHGGNLSVELSSSKIGT